ncbi:NmrA-like family-domain-containing protein [Xylogone sp. PMI_703]|nr:NmrA-like family-domain-containing protein [Xylogone sp. PMI_703]
MPSAITRSELPIRPRQEPPPRQLKHALASSFPEHQYDSLGAILAPFTKTSSSERLSKRPMPTPNKTIAVVNSSGRQAASFIRVASAVGYRVRAQLRNLDGIVASEISSLPNVTVLVGELYTKPTVSGNASPELANKATGINHDLIKELFKGGVQLAFINTTFWGDEVAIGKALADAALAAGVQHYIYSSMPNYSLVNPDWPSLPLWSSKHTVEMYIRSLASKGLQATFLYTGIYNNNFTSLLYPLFCMELQPDGSFLWQAPFHPDVKLPWLDAEHDVGPAVLQLIKDGPSQWGGQRIALAYEMLSPIEACEAFARGVGRPVRYKQGPIEIKVKIPAGYKEQLEALEKLYSIGAKDPRLQPPYFGDRLFEDSCPSEALALWEGYRGLEEYAREAFPLEEAANGLTWMNEPYGAEETDEEGRIEGGDVVEEEDDDDDDDEGLVIGGGVTGDSTPARREEEWLA